MDLSQSPVLMPNLAEPMDFFTRLKSMVDALSTARTVHDIVIAIAQHEFVLMGAQMGIVALLSKDGSMLESLVQEGIDEVAKAALTSIPMYLSNPMTECVRGRRTLVYNNRADLARDFPEFTHVNSLLEGAGVVIPMVLNDQTIGAIGLSYAEARSFSEWEVAFLQTAAAQCGQSIERVRLLEDQYKTAALIAQQRASQLLRGVVDCITDLVAAFGTDRKLMAYNKSYQDLYTATSRHKLYIGISLSEALACVPLELVDVCDDWTRALGGEVFTIVRKFGTEKPSPHYIESSYSSIRDSAGGLIGAVWVGRDITVRVEAEEALKRSAALLKEAETVAKIGSWEMDPDSMRIEWSDEMFRVLEFDSQAGQPPFEQIMARLSLDNDSGKAAYELTAADPTQPYAYDSRLSLADDRERWVSSRGQSKMNADGKLVKIVGTIMDITDRKILENAQRRLTAILEKTPDFVITSTLDGQILYCNQAFREFIGIDTESADLGTLNVRDHFSSTSRLLLTDEIHPVLLVSGEWSGESSFIGRNGKVTPVSLKVFDHTVSGGKAMCRSAIARDISEQKATEEALRMAQARLDDAQRIARFGSWEIEVATGQIAVSREFALLIERDPDGADLTYAELLTSYVPEDASRLDVAVKRAVAQGIAYELDLRREQKDGSIRSFHETGKPIMTAQGKVIKLIDTSKDTTEQQELESQLRQVQKMETIGAFAGAIAHDFNNLLAIVMGNAELIADLPHNQDDYKACIESIQSAVDRGSNLTHQLLGFAHKQTNNPAVLQPNDLLAGMTTMLRPLLGQSVKLVTHFGTNLSRVFIDANQLEQVILNLVVNARDAMPHGGTLTLSREDVVIGDEVRQDLIPPGHYVVIIVSDTGTGMTREVQKRLFEPFFTTKEKDRGTGLGLGLATVFGIVKQGHGYIVAQSEVGVGSSFNVYLPAYEEGNTILTSPAPELKDAVSG